MINSGMTGWLSGYINILDICLCSVYSVLRLFVVGVFCSAPSSTCSETVVLEPVHRLATREVNVLSPESPPGHLWRFGTQNGHWFGGHDQWELEVGGHLVPLSVTQQNQLAVGGNVPVSGDLLLCMCASFCSVLLSVG